VPADFFLFQSDYIYFLYGLSFVLLAAVLWTGARRAADEGWGILALFGLLHGIHEWGEMTAMSLDAADSFLWARGLLLAASFFCLALFARKILQAGSGREMPAWPLALLACACLAGIAWGPRGLAATARLGLALPGGLAAAWGLRLLGTRQGTDGRRLKGAALCMGFYALLAGAVTGTDALPGWPVDEAWFLGSVGLPVQACRTALAALFSAALWFHFCGLSAGIPEKGLERQVWIRRRVVFVTLFLVLAGGWGATQLAGEMGREYEAEQIQSVLSGVRDNLVTTAGAAERTAQALSTAYLVRRGTGEAWQGERLNEALDRFAAILPGTVTYFVDSRGVARASSNRHDPDSFVGWDFGFREFIRDALRNGAGDMVAVGVVSGVPGYYNARRVEDEGGKVLGVVVVKVQLTAASLGLGGRDPVYLVLREGTVLATNMPGQTLRQLWPAGTSALEDLARRRIVPQPLPPLFAGEPSNGERGLFLGGKRAAVVMPTGLSGTKLVFLAQLNALWLHRLLVICVTLLVSLLLLGAFVTQERIRRDAALLGVSERRYRSLFEDSSAVQVLVDLDGLEIVDANEAAAHFYGYPRERLRRMTLYDMTLLSAEEVEKVVADIIAGKRFYETRHRLADGRVRTLEVRPSPVERDGRQLCNYLYQDVTERVRAEEALRENGERLREVASALSRQNEKLDMALARAEEAGRAKNLFLANMSHEIRTPLNGVLGMLAHLSESELTDEQAQSVRLALDAGRGLLRLVGDILDFSRMEAGKLEIVREAVELRPFMDSVAATFRPLALGKGVRLAGEVASDAPEAFWGDMGRIRQILNNLAGNALKFTTEGSVTLLARPAGQGRLLFAVRDTGPGIPREKHREIFEAFTQVDASATRLHQGAGLGLAIVKGLAEAMGGSVEIESEPGQGTCVRVELPAEPCPAPAPEPHARAGEQAGDEHRPSLDVLLVEDDRINQVTASRFLVKWGHRVTVASNGQEALDRLRDKTFDVVLMDMQMPVLDGLSTVRILRGDPDFARCASVPVVALTAHAMKGDRERYLAEGLDGYLAKPLDPAELRRMLHAVTARA